MRVLLALVAIALSACRRERSEGMVPNDRAPAIGAPVSPGDLAAYQAGREREIAALRVLPAPGIEELDSLGAHAAGRSVAEYRQLTRSVDDALKQRSAQVDHGSQRATTLDSTLALLDSLRVEWLVLRVRQGH